MQWSWDKDEAKGRKRGIAPTRAEYASKAHAKVPDATVEGLGATYGVVAKLPEEVKLSRAIRGTLGARTVDTFRRTPGRGR